MGNKMALAVTQGFPVFEVTTEVNFFCGPKGSFMAFVLLPDYGIIDGENDKTVFVFVK
jgi:hypothetical protein